MTYSVRDEYPISLSGKLQLSECTRLQFTKVDNQFYTSLVETNAACKDMSCFEIELRELNRWHSFSRYLLSYCQYFFSQQRVSEKVEKAELRTLLLPRTGGLQVLLPLSTTHRFTITIMQPLPSSLKRKQKNRQTLQILPAPRDFSLQTTENAKINAVGRF